jgi:hypothetical protein
MTFHEIVTKINNAFFRIESFMNGTISEYQYFGFNEAFTNLFCEARKPENFTYNNCKLIGKYWELTEQIRVDYDKSKFENFEAYENEMFCKDCEEIMYLNWERIEKFIEFSTPDEIAESEPKFSITDILKPQALPPQQNESKKEQETRTFTNNFDQINPTEIYEHFKAGLVEKGYLTEQELNKYLKVAFEIKTVPETLFKLKQTPTKQKIYTVFYTYYKDIAQKKHNTQKKYASLLGDFFEGYNTDIIKTNWARDYKIKR